MNKDITNLTLIDSCDVINRIEELKALGSPSLLEIEELELLLKLESEAGSASDWGYCEPIIREDYFTQYIEELIDDCYSIPEESKSNEWPWRHMYLDYGAAAEEAKQDYIEFNWNGSTYFILA